MTPQTPTGPQPTAGTQPPVAPEPDTKDWTWVLARPCPECGFQADGLRADELAGAVAASAAAWREILTGSELGTRPAPRTWSALEYACHVRDVFVLFRERIELMLAEVEPRFANWDQDATATKDRYDLQDPQVVAVELAAAAAALTPVLATLTDAQWARTGVRSDGSRFTVESIVRYMLHDLAHHVHDVEAARGGQPT